MGAITDLRKQRRKEDRLNVFIDGEYAFSLHETVACDLRVGQELSSEQCDRLRFRDEVHYGIDRTLHFLSFRPRSKLEIDRYLARKGFDQDVSERVVEALIERGLIDDQAFAEFWIRNREDFRPRSAWVLRGELRQKGVSDEIIERVLDGIDEAESAYRAAEGRCHRLAHLDEETFRRRLGGFLQRRGFGYSVVKDVVDRLWHECAADPDDRSEA